MHRGFPLILLDENLDDTPQSDNKDEAGKEPTASLDEAELFARLKRWFRMDKAHSDDWRDQAKEDYDFQAGEQWSSEERATLREQMRPVITFNRIDPVISAVAGTEVTNRQEVRYLPRKVGNAEPDEMLSEAAKFIRDECDAEDEESDAFVDLLICGMGWTETRIDFDEDADGKTIIDRVDPLEMYWDAACRKRNLEDARRVFRAKRMPISEARVLAPEAEDEDLDAKWASNQDTNSPVETRQESRFYRPNRAPTDGPMQGEDDLVTIVEAQWWERETFYQVRDPQSGQTIDLSQEEHSAIKKRVPGIQSVQLPKRVYRKAFIGAKLLTPVEKIKSPFGEDFSFKAMTGKRDRNKGTYYGLVKSMKDPQRWANKWLSQTLHIMNTNAKGGIIAEKGAFDDDREMEKTWSKPDAVTWAQTGALTGPNGSKIQPKPVGQFPAGYFQLLEFAVTSARDASGVNLEILGQQTQDQAGVLEMQRKKQAMAVLATMFDSLRRYRKSQGRLLLFMIQNYMSDQTLVRVTEDSQQKYVALGQIRDPSVAKYDAVVDDSPSSPNQKDLTWALIVQMLPMIKDKLSPDLLAALFQYSPLPATAVEKISGLLTQNLPQQQKEAQEANQLKKADAFAKIDKTHADAELAKAKADREQLHTAHHFAKAVVPQPMPMAPDGSMQGQQPLPPGVQ